MERNAKHIYLWHILRGFGSQTRLVRPGRSGPNAVPDFPTLSEILLETVDFSHFDPLLVILGGTSLR